MRNPTYVFALVLFTAVNVSDPVVAQSVPYPALFIHLNDLPLMPFCQTAPCSIDVAAGDGHPARPYSALFPSGTTTPSVTLTGVQLSLPWSAVITNNVFDGSKVLPYLRPWATQNPPISVGLSFRAVDESVVSGEISALPAFIVNDPSIAKMQCIDNGTPLSDAPVYWTPTYQAAWTSFIAAAFAYLANPANAINGQPISYLRFGVGQGDETIVQVDMGNANSSSPAYPHQSCLQEWHNATGKTQSQQYTDYVNYSMAVLSTISAAQAAAPTMIPAYFDVNDLGSFQPRPANPLYSVTMSNQAQAYGLTVGNEGFGNQAYPDTRPQYVYSTKFGDIYNSGGPRYMQTCSPGVGSNCSAGGSQYTALPCIYYTAMHQFTQGGVGVVGTFEVYYDDMLTADNLSGNNYVGTSPSPAMLSSQIANVLNGGGVPPASTCETTKGTF